MRYLLRPFNFCTSNLFKLVKRSIYNKHMAYSDFLKQVESECDRSCPEPIILQKKVTVIGAGTRIGRIASMILKQEQTIKNLSLYDDVGRGVICVAQDIVQMDSRPRVSGYEGRTNLKKALHGADLVLICGGLCGQPSTHLTDDQLFFINYTYVNSMIISCTEFCPKAVIALAVPPIDCNFAMAVHALKKMDLYDRRKILGLNSLAAMRATKILSSLKNTDPAANRVPIVGGGCPSTVVPAFSSASDKISDADMRCIMCLIRYGDNVFNSMQCPRDRIHLSMGYALGRSTANIMKGLFKSPTIVDSAIIEQENPSKSYGFEFCSASVTIDRGGIVSASIPNLSEKEQKILNCSRAYFKARLNMGKSIGMGEDMYYHIFKMPTIHIDKKSAKATTK